MTIKEKNYSFERALYGSKGITLIKCTFDGAEDGESALKESSDVEAKNCYFNLRYPLWHNKNVNVINSTMTENCRAAIWYSSNVSVNNCKLYGIKAIRECSDITLKDTEVISPEFLWKNRGIQVKNCKISGEYPFFMSSDISLENVSLSGKYSFQYTQNVSINNCRFDTKDAFWHAKNITVKDSIIKGEYFGWYSENLTLVNCEIRGTQPLCYCKGLKLINCVMKDADLSFEYSEVEAEITGDIISVKNPLSGSIKAREIGKVIITEDSVYPSQCKIIQSKTQK